jgi:alcohol dehydrogenase
MRAAVYHGPYQIAAETVPDPSLVAPTDAIVQVEAAAVCGSDLWTYRGQGSAAPGDRIGHEFVGSVVAIGHEVGRLVPGDWVIAPFRCCDGVCVHCRRGLESSCVNGGFWGRAGLDGGQGQFVRVPFADGTLVKALDSGSAPPAALIPHLLTLADVLSTGYHAAKRAGIEAGDTVAVVGDGAVGLCAVLVARLLGAQTVLAFGGQHPERLALARAFGADSAEPIRGQAAIEFVADRTGGIGVDRVIEAVGTSDSFATAVHMVRDGATVSYVGLPHGVTVELAGLFPKNIAIVGGIAPARHYIPQLLPLILDGRITPGDVFTVNLALDQIGWAYDLMDQRGAVKVLLDRFD